MNKEIDISEYKNALEASGMSEEAFDAGIHLGIPPRKVADSYYGYYRNDIYFAQDMADSFASPSSEAITWPNTCIDWELAARELMFDYAVWEGHYFRVV